MKRTISTLLLVLLCLTPVSVRYWIQQAYGAECEDSCSDPVQLARMSPAVLGASGGAGSGVSCGNCQGPANCTNAALGCIARETFDGSSECVSGGTNNCDNLWTVLAGTPSYNNTDHELNGTYCCLNTGSNTGSYIGLSSDDEYYLAAGLYIEKPSTTASIISLRATSSQLCKMNIDSSGNIIVISLNGTSSSTVATIDTGTYYIKIRAKNPNECEGWVSSDGKNWGTSQTSTGSWTSDINRCAIAGSTSSTSSWIDDVRVHTSDIAW